MKHRILSVKRIPLLVVLTALLPAAALRAAAQPATALPQPDIERARDI